MAGAAAGDVDEGRLQGQAPGEEVIRAEGDGHLADHFRKGQGLADDQRLRAHRGLVHNGQTLAPHLVGAIHIVPQALPGCLETRGYCDGHDPSLPCTPPQPPTETSDVQSDATVKSTCSNRRLQARPVGAKHFGGEYSGFEHRSAPNVGIVRIASKMLRPYDADFTLVSVWDDAAQAASSPGCA